MIEYFKKNTFSTKIFPGYKRKLFKDLFVRIIDKHKDNVHNILLFWARFFLITQSEYNKGDLTTMVYDLNNDIKSFITESSEEKYVLIDLCKLWNPINDKIVRIGGN